MNQSSTKDPEDPKFFIRSMLLNETFEMPITEKEFKDFKQASQRLVAGFELEELYDLIINNYRELEKEAVSLAVDQMVLEKDQSEDLFEIRFAMNRRVVNILTASRMYLDQYISRLKKLNADAVSVKSACHDIYDRLFEYRFMEALRNHVQHGGTAVHRVEVNCPWHVQEGKKYKRSFSISLYSNKSELNENDSFRKSVLNECPEKVDVIPAVRVYISGISSLHECIRSLIEETLKESRALFDRSVDRYKRKSRRAGVALQAVCKKQGEVDDVINIVFDADNVRKLLLKRNKILNNLRNYYVTGEYVSHTR